MTLTHILIFASIAAFLGLVLRKRGRTYILMIVSILTIYALQPVLPIRNLDFWLPTLTLSLTVISWLLTATTESRSLRLNWSAVLIILGLTFLLGLTRYLDIGIMLTASRPPQIGQIAVAAMMMCVLALILGRFPILSSIVWIVFLLVIFIALKTPALAVTLSGWLRGLTMQSVELASPLDLRWLGFSYIAFRVLHTLRDRQTGRLPAVSLAEYVTYVIFFPAVTAGPIDRLERFIGDLRRPLQLGNEDFLDAGKRLGVGLFKKFVIADTLALIALNGENALQVQHAGWMWVLVYAYAFQIFFDFSGYTDIAIGISKLLGFHLPENFNAPYIKNNLTLFWNNWHMTLTQWFRAYFFNPATRWLRSKRMAVPLIIFMTQMSTMLLIGLWHGVTWNFVLWGIWHGLGLFIHNRWSDWTRVRITGWAVTKPRQILLNLSGVLLTFHFVALGWVFFALATPEMSWRVIVTLFGVSG